MQPFNVLFSQAFAKCVGGNSIVSQFPFLEKRSERGCAKVYLKLSKPSALHTKKKFSINLKKAGGQFDPPPCGFFKNRNVFSRERVKLCFL